MCIACDGGQIDPIVSCTGPPAARSVANASPVPVLLRGTRWILRGTLQGRIRRHTPAAGGAYGGFAIAARETRTPCESLPRSVPPRLAHLSTASTRALGRDAAYRRPRPSVDPRGAIRSLHRRGGYVRRPVTRTSRRQLRGRRLLPASRRSRSPRLGQLLPVVRPSTRRGRLSAPSFASGSAARRPNYE